MHKSHTWHCIFDKNDFINIYNKRASNSKFNWEDYTIDSINIIDVFEEDNVQQEQIFDKPSYGLLKVSILVETLKENNSKKSKKSLWKKLICCYKN